MGGATKHAENPVELINSTLSWEEGPLVEQLNANAAHSEDIYCFGLNLHAKQTLGRSVPSGADVVGLCLSRLFSRSEVYEFDESCFPVD